MKIILLCIGKTSISYVNEGIDDFLNRINYFCPVEIVTLIEPKNHSKLPINEQKLVEKNLILKNIDANDEIILLDEKGKTYNSISFANQLERWLTMGRKRLVFIVGGPYGLHASLLAAFPSVSLSQMTMNHQIVRLFFLEQIYRAFTIIKGIPYHNE